MWTYNITIEQIQEKRPPSTAGTHREKILSFPKNKTNKSDHEYPILMTSAPAVMLNIASSEVLSAHLHNPRRSPASSAFELVLLGQVF